MENRMWENGFESVPHAPWTRHTSSDLWPVRNISRPSLSLSNICSLHPGNPWHLFLYLRLRESFKTSAAKFSWSHNDESVRPAEFNYTNRLWKNGNLRRSFFQLQDQLGLKITVEIIQVPVNQIHVFFVMFLWTFCSLNKLTSCYYFIFC